MFQKFSFGNVKTDDFPLKLQHVCCLLAKLLWRRDVPELH